MLHLQSDTEGAAMSLPDVVRPLTAKLEPKQAKFCIEYQVDGNATQAAIRAGYSAKTMMASCSPPRTGQST